jgi:predicted Zn-dependent peptidase
MKEITINDGIVLHFIDTNRFKTNYIVVNIITKLDRETITKNALVPLVLRRGSEKYPSMKEISVKLEEMYGASFDATTDKIGDKALIQFVMDGISNEYTLDDSDIIKEMVKLLDNIILHPLLEDGAFKAEYVEKEKGTLKEIIESRINDKAEYSSSRAVEEMYQDKPYGLYKFGYVEDLTSITPEELYKYYKEMLKEAQIQIYLSGNANIDEVAGILKEDFATIDRECKEAKNDKLCSDKLGEYREVKESQNVTQGKIVLGYLLDSQDLEKDFYSMIVYNTILGGSASAKLFNNVREKKSLAYTIHSQYLKHKGAMFVYAGIENENFDIAKESILKEIDDMKVGNISATELSDAKVNLTTKLNSFKDSQSAMIGWCIGQKLLSSNEDIEKAIENINAIKLEDILNVANRLEHKITYFLTA